MEMKKKQKQPISIIPWSNSSDRTDIGLYHASAKRKPIFSLYSLHWRENGIWSRYLNPPGRFPLSFPFSLLIFYFLFFPFFSLFPPFLFSFLLFFTIDANRFFWGGGAFDMPPKKNAGGHDPLSPTDGRPWIRANKDLTYLTKKNVYYIFTLVL